MSGERLDRQTPLGRHGVGVSCAPSFGYECAFLVDKKMMMPPDSAHIPRLPRRSIITAQTKFEATPASKRPPLLRIHSSPVGSSSVDPPTFKMDPSPERTARVLPFVSGIPTPTRSSTFPFPFPFSAVGLPDMSVSAQAENILRTVGGVRSFPNGGIAPKPQFPPRVVGRAPTTQALSTPGDVEQLRGSFSAVMVPRELHGRVEIQGDPSRGFTEYGKGAWSVVYQAVYLDEPPLNRNGTALGMPSPPVSPVQVGSMRPPGPRMVAVKAPLKAQVEKSEPILWKEARILTYLQPSFPASASSRQEHIVTFLGFETNACALVLEGLPLTLLSFSQTRAKAARDAFSTRNMHEPVVGTQQWLIMATHLVDGLDYLHAMNVVHGDIKPANILLRARPPIKRDAVADTTTLFDPVYCDFSSARVMQPGIVAEPVSAVTASYTAPELLEALRPRSSDRVAVVPVVTYASDVFALGATLLVPATGREPYSDASSSMQRLAAAIQGQPLAAAQQGQQASRVMKGGLVDRFIERAVANKPAERWDARSWKMMVERESEGYDGYAGLARMREPSVLD